MVVLDFIRIFAAHKTTNQISNNILILTIMNYIIELLSDGNTTVLDVDRAAFLEECERKQLNVIVTDEADYQGHVYTRYDLV